MIGVYYASTGISAAGYFSRIKSFLTFCAAQSLTVSSVNPVLPNFLDGAPPHILLFFEDVKLQFPKHWKVLSPSWSAVTLLFSSLTFDVPLPELIVSPPASWRSSTSFVVYPLLKIVLFVTLIVTAGFVVLCTTRPLIPLSKAILLANVNVPV